MIALQPKLRQVGIGSVFGDLPRTYMTVVIHNGLPFCRAVVQLTGGRSIQQKLLVHKRFHFSGLRPKDIVISAGVDALLYISDISVIYFLLTSIS